MARQRGLRYVGPAELRPDPEFVKLVPLHLLQRKRVLPLSREEGRALVVVSDPDDETTLETLRRLLGDQLEVGVAEPRSLEAAIRRVTSSVGASQPASAWDAVSFLDDLLRQAYRCRASDIHLVPQEEGLVVRLRVDGRLKGYGHPLELEDATQLLSRVKVLGGLDIAEKREPQDGGFAYPVPEEEHVVDVRLATAPIRHGERATLRLLGTETQELTLEKLGLASADQLRLREVLRTPHGLVLITGPTGCGKSTTLYAALRAVLDPSLNVMTVEDPVEFHIRGVSQMQVDRAGKVTFARALRSLLRHDPDILMVGEIRDEETADMAVRAALTGHLVLSSLHSNQAPSAITRLLDLGCERGLLGSTLRAIVAQRLVRRLCLRCRAARQADAGELAAFGEEGEATVYDPTGCPACLGTGYRGRVVLAEALWIDGTLPAEIAAGASEVELARRAAEQGCRTLAADGLSKVLAGLTSLDEARAAWL